MIPPTPEETAELTQFARQHHVEIVPMVETLSNLEEILRRPEYAAWLLRERESLVGPALKDVPHLEEEILDFDDEPIVEICNEPGCSKRAVRVTAREDYPSGTEFTCALHEPTFSWCSQWGLSGYRSALSYAEISCDGCSGAYQTIIARIAEAKGIPLPREPRF